MSDSSTWLVVKGNGGRVHPGLRSLVVIVTALVVVTAGVYRFDRSTATSSSAPHYTYGGLPSWLPTSATVTDKVLYASTASPQMAIGGDVIHASLGGGAGTIVTMSGPLIPPFVAPPPPYTTATLTITLRHTSGVVILRARDFAVLDGNGHIFRPTAFLGGAKSVVATSGTPTSVRLREFMAVGSGSIRWAPQGHPLVTWEFTVEND